MEEKMFCKINLLLENTLYVGKIPCTSTHFKKQATGNKF